MLDAGDTGLWSLKNLLRIYRPKSSVGVGCAIFCCERDHDSVRKLDALAKTALNYLVCSQTSTFNLDCVSGSKFVLCLPLKKLKVDLCSPE